MAISGEINSDTHLRSVATARAVRAGHAEQRPRPTLIRRACHPRTCAFRTIVSELVATRTRPARELIALALAATRTRRSAPRASPAASCPAGHNHLAIFTTRSPPTTVLNIPEGSSPSASAAGWPPSGASSARRRYETCRTSGHGLLFALHLTIRLSNHLVRCKPIR
jgi:hypothetical protein